MRSTCPLSSIIRTGETRVYGNALLRKGVTPVASPAGEETGA